MNMIDFQHYSSDKVKTAKEAIEAHFPFKYFKTYFDWENLLLTDYRESECYNAIAILKSYDGTTLVFENCNCGYGGTGPNNTVALLSLLSIDEKQAQNYVFHNSAVELYFNPDGSLDYVNLHNTFESRKEHCPITQIDLNKIDFSDSASRTMYLIDPSEDSIIVLMQLLHIMEPTSISYYIGNDNSKYIDVELDVPLMLSKKRVEKNYSFASIKGNSFNVVCFFKPDNAKSFINNIMSALQLPSPFMELTVGGLSCIVPRQKINSTYNKVKILIKELLNKREIYSQSAITSNIKKVG